MIDLETPNEWQIRDLETGLLFPWLTNTFVKELKTWNLKDKKLFEYGLGSSTLYWSWKCNVVYGVENNKEYIEAIVELYNKKGRGWIEALGFYENKDDYVRYIKEYAPYDIVIVDGDPVEWRDDCIKEALNCITKGGILICDNWMQKEVYWPSKEIQQLLCQFPMEVFHQDGHDSWKTAVFKII